MRRPATAAGRAARTAFVLACIPVGALPLAAQDHVIWVDFTGCSFDVSAFPPGYGTAEADAVKSLIMRDMARHFANYDVQLSRFQPAAGRYTRVQVGGRRGSVNQPCALPTSPTADGFLLGTSLPEQVAAATGHASWRTQVVSRSFMYSDRLSDSDFSTIFTGAVGRDTLDRIATAVAYIASHEVGHVLGLEHWYAADTVTSGFANPSSGSSPHLNHDAITPPSVASTDIPEAYNHIMATAGTSQPSMARSLYSTTQFRFSPHISNEHLIQNVGARGYHLPTFKRPRPGGLGQYGGLLVGTVESATGVSWSVAASTGTAFDYPAGYAEWARDAGDATDLFLIGDVDGDGATDLVFGRPTGANTVAWSVARSTGSGFLGSVVLADDAGDVGDVFRMADVNGDGMDDLLYGRPQSTSNPEAIRLTWFVRTSTGVGPQLAPERQWLAHGGYQGHPIFVGDLDGDDMADLIASRIVDDQTVRWSYHASTGAGFAAPVRIAVDAGDRGDRFLVGDVNDDGQVDLVYGQRKSRDQITWYVRTASGNQLNPSAVLWNDDVGDSGDIFRLADVTGDRRADLVFARRNDNSRPLFFVSPSDGQGFGPESLWALNAAPDESLVYVISATVPRDPVVDVVTTGPPLQNQSRVRVRVQFIPPVDADSIEFVTPRSDQQVVWATPRQTRFGGTWEAVWAQDRPPQEGCVGHARALLGQMWSGVVPVDWCPHVAVGRSASPSTPAQTPPGGPPPTNPPPGNPPPGLPPSPSAGAPPATGPLAACQWRFTAGAPLSITMRGNSATFMGIPPATMFMFGSSDPADRGSGTVTASGVSGTGSYPVGTATGNPPSGSVFTDGAVGLGSGDGRPPAPPPSTLTVTAHSSTDIQGTMTGTFIEPSRPAIKVAVRLDFWARSASIGCP